MEGRGASRALFTFSMAEPFIPPLSRIVDNLLIAADDALRTISGVASASRPAPGKGAGDPAGEAERRKSAGLMRVNHAGEVCAQALYSGQALVARDPHIRATLQAAGAEERDHLAWCSERLEELGSRPSLLTPFWYAGSFAMGVATGLTGDRWSLGFLSETEAQVEKHLDGHLERISSDDARSRAILAQMRDDENRHGETGRSLGGAELPYPVKLAMKGFSRVMTRTAYWV